MQTCASERAGHSWVNKTISEFRPGLLQSRLLTWRSCPLSYHRLAAFAKPIEVDNWSTASSCGFQGPTFYPANQVFVVAFDGKRHGVSKRNVPRVISLHFLLRRCIAQKTRLKGPCRTPPKNPLISGAWLRLTTPFIIRGTCFFRCSQGMSRQKRARSSRNDLSCKDVCFAGEYIIVGCNSKSRLAPTPLWPMKERWC